MKRAETILIILFCTAAAWLHAGKGDSFYQKGNDFYLKAKYDSAHACYFEGLKKSEATGDLSGISEGNRLIGDNYRAAEKWMEGKNFLLKAIQFSRIANKSILEAKAWNRYGALLFEMSDYDSAAIAAEISRKISEKENEWGLTANNLDLLGSIAREQKNNPLALDYLNQAEAIAKNHPEQTDLPSILINKGRVLNIMGKYRESVGVLSRAMEESQRKGIKVYSEAASSLLYNAYVKLDMTDSAFHWDGIYDHYHDTLLIERMNSEIEKIHAGYDLEQKEQDNLLLRNENRRLIWLTLIVTIGLIVISLLSFVAWKNRNTLKQTNSELLQKNEDIQRKQKELLAFASNLEKTNAELENLNAMKDRMFSIISHDLRSPLNSLKGILFLLKDNSLNEKETKNLVANLTDRVEYTSGLLDNLLNWSRSQLEGFKMNPQKIDLSTLTLQVLKVLSPIAENKGVKITTNLNGGLPALGDGDMVELVIRNLLSNAIKFTPQGGLVSISATKSQNEIEFAIRDTGVGIPKEDKEKLFSPVHFTTQGTAQEKGSGIGLALCQDFIRKNGGRIWVESEQGKGSTFHFTLPKGN